MTSLEHQRVLARLVVDDFFYRAFKEDRSRALETMHLTAEQSAPFISLKLEELDTFRAVVRGTRSRRFELWFKHLRPWVSDKAWAALVDAFHADVVIKASSDMADAVLFQKWIAERSPGSLAGELSLYDLRMAQITAARPTRTSPGLFQKAACVETLRLTRPFEKLLEEPSVSLWAAGTAAPAFHYALRSSLGSDDVEVLEIDATLFNLLEALRRPRSSEEIRELTAGGVMNGEELLNALRDQSLVSASEHIAG